MPMNGRLLRPRENFTPRSISGLALWLDAADSSTLFQTDAASATPVTAPTDIAGCAIWLDGSDASTMFDATTGGNLVTAGGAIARWQDKSGNNRHATQATAANRPLLQANAINARSCVRGDGSRWIVCEGSNLNTAAITVFAVYRINEWQTGTAPFDNNPNIYHTDLPTTGFTNFGLRSENGSNSLNVRIGDADSSAVNSLGQTSAAQGVVQTQAVRFSSPTLTARVSSLRAVESTIPAAHIPATFGSRVALLTGHAESYLDRQFRGDVAEFIVFTSALADADVLRVENYLAQKWGVTQVIAPATATNDPVGAWLDKSGNGRHATQATAANRPTISATAQNGRRQLAVASSNSVLTCASLSIPAPYSVVAVVQRASRGVGVFAGSSANSNIQFGDGTSSFSGAFYLAARVAGAVYGSAPIATGRAQVFVASSTAGSLPASLSMWSDGIGGAASVTFAGTAPNNTLGGDFQVGSTSTSSWGGTVCEMIAYSKSLTLPERQRLERYLAAKWGITLAPQVSNADAQDWINRVYANGGTVSAATANAVNQFCVDIENAGIRDRFYRVNLFCGNSDGSLAAVRTPLFRGPALTGTQYGNATDTNVNFVQGDYAETGASGGLTGTGTVGGKILRTGLTPAALPVIATGHLSAYAMSGFGGTAIFALLGTLNGGFTNNFFIELNRNGAGNIHGAWGGGSFSPSLVTSAQGAGIGHVLVSRTSATALSGYRNTTGSALNTQTTSVTPATATNEWLVFAHNDQGGPTPLNVANARMGGYSIGADMTGSQAAAFYTAMQAFQTALGRQV